MSLTTDPAVVFDVDGTLALCEDTDDDFAEILLRHGAVIERSELMRIIESANSDAALVEALVPLPGRAAAYNEVMTVNAAAARKSECHTHIAPMLDTLRRDYRLFIVSGRDDASIGTILEQHRLARYFESVVGASLDATIKPDPRSLRTLLTRHGIDVSAAIYIGDKDVDVELARRAGTGFIGVTWFGNRLSGDAPRVASPADLPAAVAQMYRARSAAVCRTTSSQE